MYPLCRVGWTYVLCPNEYLTPVTSVCTGNIYRDTALTLPLWLTWAAVACSFIHLLDATSHCFISSGLDYHEPVDDSSGTDPPVISCSYSLTITIPAGSSAADGVVAIINDAIYEGPEDVFLELNVAQIFQDDGINEGSPLRATVEIEDDDGENKHFALFNLLRFTVICSKDLL